MQNYNSKFKNFFLIFLSLLFWVQFCVVIYLGVRLLFFNDPGKWSGPDLQEKTKTPAEVRGKL